GLLGGAGVNGVWMLPDVLIRFRTGVGFLTKLSGFVESEWESTRSKGLLSAIASMISDGLPERPPSIRYSSATFLGTDTALGLSRESFRTMRRTGYPIGS